MADIEQTADWLRLLHEPGEVVELRIMNTERERTVVGFYDDMDALARDAARYDGKAPALYATLNPVRPDLLARCANHCKGWGHVPPTTDADIVSRRWLLIDCDPVRPSGISATPEELTGAIDAAGNVLDYLSDNGWSKPITCLSGNGVHLLYRIELPNDAGATDLVKGCLEALAHLFDTEGVKIDKSVHNAARITKLYGTLAAKGDDTEQRKHRRSSVEAVPSDAVSVARELLERLTATLPQRPAAPHASNDKQPFDVLGFMRRHGLQVRRESPCAGGTKYLLEVCPFDSAHTDNSAVVYRFPSGAWDFTCSHNGCSGRRHGQLRELLEPGCYDYKEVVSAPKSNAPAGGFVTATPSYERKKWSELDAVEYQPMRYIVGDILTPGLTALAGRPKAGKSQTALNWGVAVALGGKASGRWDVDGGNVLYLALEDSWRRVQYRLRKKLAGLTVDSALMDRLEIQIAAPEVSDGLLSQMAEWCESHPDRRMIVLDIWQRVRGRSKAGTNPYSEDEALARPVQQLALKYDIAIVPITHTRKAGADKGNASEEITGTNGFMGVADTLMVMREEGGCMVLHVEGRDVDRQTVPMRWEAETESYVVADEGGSRVARPWMTPAQLCVIEAFDTRKEWRADIATIEEATGKEYENLRQIVRGIVEHYDSPLAQLHERGDRGQLLFALKDRIPARQQSWQDAIGPEVSATEPLRPLRPFTGYLCRECDACMGQVEIYSYAGHPYCQVHKRLADTELDGWIEARPDCQEYPGLERRRAVTEALEIVNAGVSV